MVSLMRQCVTKEGSDLGDAQQERLSSKKSLFNSSDASVSFSRLRKFPIWATSDRAFQVSPRADAADDL